MRKLKLFTIPHHVLSSISSVFTYKRIFSLAITIQYFCIEELSNMTEEANKLWSKILLSDIVSWQFFLMKSDIFRN